MQKKQFRRCLAFVLSLHMVFAFIMPSALAVEGGECDNALVDDKAFEVALVETENTSIESYESGAESEDILSVEKLQDRIDAILTSFGVVTEMTDNEIANAITKSDSMTIENAITERNAIDDGAINLTQEQLLMLDLGLYERFWNVFDELYTPVPAVKVTGADGVEVTCDSNGSISESNGTVTVKAAGSFTTRKTTVITIENTSGGTATISFDVSVSNYDAGESTIDDLGGNFSQNLINGQKVTYKLCSTRFSWDNTGVATLSNFQVKKATTKFDVNLSYDINNGSVTIDGTKAAPDIYQIASATFTATANEGATFLGWINPITGKVISTDATYNVVASEAVTMEAVFAGNDKAWFFCSDKEYLFGSLKDATNHAINATNKTIVLANNGILSADNYTIPSGVTLLVPFDDANTLCTEAPAIHENAYTIPSVYRTLTMASGANITVNGAISVSGSQSSKYSYNGMPSGPLGFIKMNSGSTITVENGANLYAWGYITGSGSVEVNSGGTVHECFQIADYRGGDATSQIVGKDDAYGVFPFNQYYLQNVEVPLTLHVGAKENGYGSVYVTVAGTKSLSVPFVGASDSMFVINTGYVVKDYMEGTGRTSINVYGDMTITEISMSMKVALVGSLNIDTSKYALPIPNHMTMSVESGTISLNQNIEFLPGSELYVKEGANCVLGEGKQIYVYDMDQWLYNNGANGYAGTGNKPYINIPYVPGGNGTTGRLKDALIQVDGTVDVSLGNAYVTSGGANIYSTGTGVVKVASTIDTVTYQVITADTEIDSWPSIEMQPLILQDGDGTTVFTATVANEGYGEGTYTYYADIQKWCPPGHRYNGGVVTKPTCTDNGYTVYTCLACGDSYTDADSVQSALGHSWSNWTNKSADDVPSATNVGTQTRVCTNCTKSEERAVFKIYGTSVKVGDSLELYFYIHKDVLNSDDISSGAYNAKLTRAYVDDPKTDTKNDACEKETNISSNTWQVYGDYYRFCYSGIAAKEMMDEVKVVIYHNGEEASIEATETIAGYAERTLRKYEKKKTEDSSNFTEKNEQLQTILVDMLNYGAACQTFFEYDTENLATKNISVYSGYASSEMQTCTEGDITGSYDASISAKNKLMYSFYIDSVVPVSATVTYTNHYGTEITPEVSVAKTTKEVDGETKTYYRVDVPGLAIADGRQKITCVVKDANNVETTFTGSIQSFVAKKQALLKDNDTTNDPKADEMTAYEMLIKFVDSARTYFGTAASNTAA